MEVATAIGNVAAGGVGPDSLQASKTNKMIRSHGRTRAILIRPPLASKKSKPATALPNTLTNQAALGPREYPAWLTRFGLRSMVTLTEFFR